MAMMANPDLEKPQTPPAQVDETFCRLLGASKFPAGSSPSDDELLAAAAAAMEDCHKFEPCADGPDTAPTNPTNSGATPTTTAPDSSTTTVSTVAPIPAKADDTATIAVTATTPVNNPASLLPPPTYPNMTPPPTPQVTRTVDVPRGNGTTMQVSFQADNLLSPAAIADMKLKPARYDNYHVQEDLTFDAILEAKRNFPNLIPYVTENGVMFSGISIDRDDYFGNPDRGLAQQIHQREKTGPFVLMGAGAIHYEPDANDQSSFYIALVDHSGNIMVKPFQVRFNKNVNVMAEDIKVAMLVAYDEAAKTVMNHGGRK